MYGYGFRFRLIQCRYSAHIQSTNVHICIDTIHCKIHKYFYTKIKQCMYIKKSFFKKKIGTGVFCTTNIHVIVSHTCTCVTHTSVPS